MYMRPTSQLLCCFFFYSGEGERNRKRKKNALDPLQSANQLTLNGFQAAATIGYLVESLKITKGICVS